jgi:hypothetical protein
MPQTTPLEALQKIAGRAKPDGSSGVEVRFDATYTDRDGRTYPAHIEHLDATAGRESEPLFRVWVDSQQNEVLFKVSAAESGREFEQFWKLTYDPDGTQRQQKIDADEARELAAGCTEFKCLLFTPRTVPHSLSSDNNEPYSRSIKIPVVDLLVDFGDAARGIKINHVGNVRHARHAGARPGEIRMPYYTAVTE